MMNPINYIEPVFRPPSEWKSLILQVTNGCSWNKCTFCDMYTSDNKKFKPKKIDIIEQEIIAVAKSGETTRRVFLADGDAMMLPFKRLKEILELIKLHLPQVSRVSSYCLPRNLGNKTVEQLAILSDLGLKLMYVGCESGDDEVLALVEKGEALYRIGNPATSMAACGACHGPAGEGVALAKFPALAGQHADYIATQLKKFRSGERSNDGDGRIMRSVAARINDKEIEAVSSYISGLHK